MRLLKDGPVQTRMGQIDGKTVFQRTQDCDPIVDRCKALHNEGHHGTSEMRHVASIPLVIVERYCNDNGITFPEFMNGQEHIKRLCNDPDLSYFRVAPGHV